MANETKLGPAFEVPLALGVHIFQVLREQIITGKLREGARLNETALQVTFGTSRSPIREAFHRLETEGLVEMNHRRGAFVRSISSRDAIEAIVIRGCLERLALHLAPRPLSSRKLEELLYILGQVDEAKEKQDGQELTSLYWRFHKAIIGLSENRILARIYPSVTEPFIPDRLTHRFLKKPERFSGLGDREIYDLLASGQISEAAEMVEQHANAFAGFINREGGAKDRKGNKREVNRQGE